jgi:uncharacterized DUF497 family protein
MDVEFYPRKRVITLRERGLDFAEAGASFSGPFDALAASSP